MEGSSSRRMISPFTLEDDQEKRYVPTGAVFGDFLGGDSFTDIVAIAQPERDEGFEDNPGATLLAPSSVWAIPGSDGAGGLDASGLGFEEFSETSQFLLGCARWVSGDLNLDGADELVGIDKATECSGVSNSPTPQVLVVSNNQPGEPTPLDTSGLVAPESAKLVDLDNDGDEDLLVVFIGEFRTNTDVGGDGGGGEEIEGSGVAVFWNIDGAIDFTGIAKIQVPDFSQLRGVTPMRLDGDRYDDLLILSDAGLYKSMYDPQTGTFSEPTWFLFQPGTHLLASGDLNGDGLEDFAFVYGVELEIRLAAVAPPLGSQTAQTEDSP